MRWTVKLEGGPKRVNHAACAIGDKIYSFGGYCSGEIRSTRSPLDVHVLDTNTYRWSRVFGESPVKRISSVTNRTVSFTEDIDSQYMDFNDSLDDDENEYSGVMPSFSYNDAADELAREPMSEEELTALDWHYNPLAVNENVGEMNLDELKTTPFQRYGHSVCEFNKKAYLWGGRNDEFGASKLLHEYDPATNTWSSIDVKGYIPPARDGHSCVVWGHKMIVFGGFEEDNQRFSSETYVFDFLTSQWTELKTEGVVPQYRDFHAACVLNDRMYVFGGRCDERGQWHSNVDYYDPFIHYLDLTTNTWYTPKQLEESSPPGRRSNTLWSYDEKIYMFGGYESKSDRHFNDLYCFDPKTSTWSLMKPAGEKAPSARRRQCSVVVDNRLFLFGGTRPHEKRRGALIDLGDLYVLDYENKLSSICIDTLLRTKFYPKYAYLLPEHICQDIESMITPNELSH
ncbi:Kelch repeat type 2 and Kelch repeat type 1 domain containing protein [Aphelenchoides besseyi]|nr:Kelch repeat type 2 and Kelch repeat type 1 domain containing protein [Aphelenchoides besseyi]KAI6236701.1 Kelch repeat type 2 and Kelch repeat type 1 domain containing protein [Aphelenchoides besseyi]